MQYSEVQKSVERCSSNDATVLFRILFDYIILLLRLTVFYFVPLRFVFPFSSFAYVVGEIVMVVLNFDPSENLLKEKKMKFKAFIQEKSLSIGTKKIGRRQITYVQYT